MVLKRFRNLTRTPAGRVAEVCTDIIENNFRFTKSTAPTRVTGDANANGTSITTLSVSSGKYFVCTQIVAFTNVAAILRIGTGTLGAMTDIYPVDLYNSLSFVAITEQMPIFAVDATSAAATVRMYAPQAGIDGLTNNNDTNHYFYGFMGGIMYDAIEN